MTNASSLNIYVSVSAIDSTKPNFLQCFFADSSYWLYHFQPSVMLPHCHTCTLAFCTHSISSDSGVHSVTGSIFYSMTLFFSNQPLLIPIAFSHLSILLSLPLPIPLYLSSEPGLHIQPIRSHLILHILLKRPQIRNHHHLTADPPGT